MWIAASETEQQRQHICCSEKGRFRITSLRRIALRRAPCCNLMWAYPPWGTRQSASLCAKEPPHTNLRRPSVRWSLPSQSSCRRVRQSTLFEHSQPWPIHRASQCLSELLRHDVLLSESIQLVLIFRGNLSRWEDHHWDRRTPKKYEGKPAAPPSR